MRAQTEGRTDVDDPILPTGQLLALGTSTLSDALDRLSIAGQCFGIKPLEPTFQMVGRAFTVRYGPIGVDGGSVGDYIDDVAPGQVVVLDNAGRVDVTVWGDLLTLTASRRGVAGFVIDGVCRDSLRSVELHYPIFSRGSWMRTGKDRVRVEEMGGTVQVGGVRVRAGDALVGDRDGVLALPAERLDAILEAARQIAGAEAEIRARVEAGSTLREARDALGYHQLQSANR